MVSNSPMHHVLNLVIILSYYYVRCISQINLPSPLILRHKRSKKKKYNIILIVFDNDVLVKLYVPEKGTYHNIVPNN